MRRLDVGLLLVLTFGTGVVDAVGYLGLDKVFAGNMTGNVVILGMGLAGAPGLPVAGPALALAAFLLGAAAVGRTRRFARASGWAGLHSVCFAAVAALLVAATVLLVPGAAPGRSAIAATVLLALAMGAQAAAARHLAVPDVTTVVVTSTITSLASDRWRGDGQPWVRRVLAIVGIAAGAAVGALLLTVHIALATGLAALLVLGVALTGHAARRRGPAVV